MKKAILLLSTLSIGLGCANPSRKKEDLGDYPILYRATRGTQTVDLLGTVHIPIHRLDPRIREHIKSSSIVVTEMDTISGKLSESHAESDWHSFYDVRIELLARELGKERFALENEKDETLRKCTRLEEELERRRISVEFDPQDPESVKGEASLQNCILAERNLNWMERLEPLLKHRQKIFIAVGLLHILHRNPRSSQSLLFLLKQRGYQVERISGFEQFTQ